jgi:hypothetical protein
MAKKKAKKKVTKKAKAKTKTKAKSKAQTKVKTKAKATKRPARKKARRTVLYSSKGKKLYAKRDKGGKFKDIQQYSRAHAMDIKRSAAAEAPPAEPATPLASVITDAQPMGA